MLLYYLLSCTLVVWCFNVRVCSRGWIAGFVRLLLLVFPFVFGFVG